MEDKILREFYYGNYVPVQCDFMTDPQAARAAAELTRLNDLLRERIGKDELAILDQMEGVQSTMECVIEERRYIDGFRAGARFMLEILEPSDLIP